MTILFDGIIGSESYIAAGIFLGVMAIGVLGYALYAAIHSIGVLEALFAFLCGVILVAGAVLSLMDTREHIIKATLDNTVSFVELEEQYEFKEKEGDIYVFKVKEVEDE